MRLYGERGGEIVFYPTTGEYGVPSESEEGALHTVNLRYETCTCEDHSYRGATCAHIHAAERKRAEFRRRKRARRGSLLERYRHEDLPIDERLELEESLLAGGRS